MFGDTSKKAYYLEPLLPRADEHELDSLRLPPLYTMTQFDMPGEGAFGLKTFVEHMASGFLRMPDCRGLAGAPMPPLPAGPHMQPSAVLSGAEWQAAELSASQCLQSMSNAGRAPKRVHENRIHTGRKGVGTVACVLTREIAQQIYAHEKADAKMLAEQYGVSPTTVYNIMNRKTWKEDTKHLWAQVDLDTFERRPKRGRGNTKPLQRG